MIMVDSGVWIDFFKKKINRETDILKDLIRKNEYVVINYLIIMEVLQGKRHEKDYREAKEVLDNLRLLEIDYNTILTAISIFRTCQKGIKQNNITGQTLKTTDCIIASQCIENDLPIFTRDKHFKMMQEFFPELKIYYKH